MSYTPFKMTPKGPIMKKMLSASQKSNLPTEVKQGMVDSGKYEGPLQYEKNPDDLIERKDKEAGVTSKMRKPRKSTKSLHSPLEPDATNEYNNEMKEYKRRSNTPKNRADFNPGYEGGDYSKEQLKNMTAKEKKAKNFY